MNANSNPTITKIIGATNQTKARPIDSLSLFVDLLVLPTLTKLQVFWKRKIPQKSNSELSTPTGPACIQNSTTGPSFHAGPKAMGTFTFYIRRLKGALAHFIPLLAAGKTVSLSKKKHPFFTNHTLATRWRSSQIPGNWGIIKCTSYHCLYLFPLSRLDRITWDRGSSKPLTLTI